MDTELTYYLRLAEDPARRTTPPKSFARFLGIEDVVKPNDVRFAWRLFLEEKRRLTVQEVKNYIKERKKRVVDPDTKDVGEVGCVESHFLDSGSFTLWTKAAAWAKKKGKREEEFYERKSFFAYMDAYAEFIKTYKEGIDYYANVDAIGYPEATYKNQKYLEKQHGLKPVPVVHYKTDLKWLRRYIAEGYDFIALGGLVGSTDQDHCRSWIDRAFDIVCDQPSRLPKIRLHGFGVQVYDLIIRYPWWSVDSTSWTKVGAFGGIFVPHRRRGEWVFDEAPYVMKVSLDSPDRKNKGKHVLSLPAAERGVVCEWLKYIKVPMGVVADNGDVVEHGVITRHSERKVANLLFFEEMRKHLPDWPWPFHSTRRQGFGIIK